MLSILTNRAFAALFAAQVVALLGTGLMTVALGLLAFDLAGGSAGAVLGTALTIKMVAYVGLAPVAGAIAERLPRKAVLIGADLVRASVALALPFIDAVWHIYVLVFVLQAASATFTPAFQATIPDVLPDEGDYTRALSLSRLAYELENLASPALAGLLLTVASYHWLFSGTVAGFALSAFLVWRAALPPRQAAPARPFRDRLTRGMRIYLATPRLRGLLALNLSAAMGGAFVLVNTVVLVKSVYGRGDFDVAMAMAAFGLGSMLAALALPRWLDTHPERGLMIAAAWALGALCLVHAGWRAGAGPLPWPGLLALWAVTGLAWSALLTPGGRLLRRSAAAPDRPALFTAQFALSHAAWLLAYPLAGWAGEIASLGTALALLGAATLVGALLAMRLWPARDPAEIAHDHPGLAPDHPHLTDHPAPGGRHRHAYVIDDLHPDWPRRG